MGRVAMIRGRKYAVFASNLHRGGAIQVAASVIEELAHTQQVPQSTMFEISTEVAAEIPASSLGKINYRIANRRPWQIWRWGPDLFRRWDAAVVIFGPWWFPLRARSTAEGYADVTAIYPDPSKNEKKKCVNRWRAVRAALSRLELRRHTSILVETRAMQERLFDLKLHERVLIAPNAVSARVRAGKKKVSLPDGNGYTAAWRLAYITADYAHKNLEILPLVREELCALGHECTFVTTLPPAAWDGRSQRFKNATINVGNINQEQIASLYSQCDGAFFPSLLEAYSAAPIEAMHLGVPVFASDRAFVRTVCGTGVVYIDPLDAKDCARVIAAVLSDANAVRAICSEAEKVVRGLPSPDVRARVYLSCLLDRVGGI